MRYSLLVLGLCTTLAVWTASASTTNHNFYGNVLDSLNKSLIGVNVTAWINGTQRGSCITENAGPGYNSYYNLDVQGSGSETGSTVTFTVDGVACIENASFTSFGHTSDFTVHQEGVGKNVLVNEFTPNSDVDWIELYNNGSYGVSIAGWQINTYAVPNLTMLHANSFTVLYSNTTISGLNNSQGNVTLLDESSVLKDELVYFNGQTYGNTRFNSSTPSSIGRYPDGSDSWYVFTKSTPGGSNQLSTQTSSNLSLYSGWNLISLPVSGAATTTTSSTSTTTTSTSSTSSTTTTTSTTSTTSSTTTSMTATTTSSTSSTTSTTLDVDLAVGEILMSQGVDIGLSPKEDLGAVTVPRVAGRSTVVRAFVEVTGNSSLVSNVTARLYGELGGTPLSGSPLEAPLSSVAGSPSTSNWTHSLNFLLPESWVVSNTSFYLELDPDNQYTESNESNNRVPASNTTEFEFQDTPSFDLMIVPVIQGGLTTNTSSYSEIEDWIQWVYPIPNLSTTIHSTVTYNGTPVKVNGENWDDLLDFVTTLRGAESSQPDLYYLALTVYISGVVTL